MQVMAPLSCIFYSVGERLKSFLSLGELGRHQQSGSVTALHSHENRNAITTRKALMTEVAAEISANLLFKPGSFPPVMDCVSVILIVCRLSL